MTRAQARTVTLEIASRVEMLDVVQTALSHVSGLVGFDDEATHYMSVAVRESVVNAIKHGNGMDETRRVGAAFFLSPGSLEIEIQDEGPGFDPGSIADPLADENLLKAAGRGMFFMRSFMDEVSYAFPAKGGTVVKLVKRLPA